MEGGCGGTSAPASVSARTLKRRRSMTGSLQTAVRVRGHAAAPKKGRRGPSRGWRLGFKMLASGGGGRGWCPERLGVHLGGRLGVWVGAVAGRTASHASRHNPLVCQPCVQLHTTRVIVRGHGPHFPAVLSQTVTNQRRHGASMANSPLRVAAERGKNSPRRRWLTTCGLRGQTGWGKKHRYGLPARSWTGPPPQTHTHTHPHPRPQLLQRQICGGTTSPSASWDTRPLSSVGVTGDHQEAGGGRRRSPSSAA